ncbi:MAG: 2-aminoethylphosphonate--pyruvate transaminase [Paracoccaceae bacterium]|nr:2-aminoethylphosphonate--pyruvate transaminase [Paracoccaceae bacterium]
MITNLNTGISETGDPLLLTPGPLTTSLSVKEAMLHDWGSRDTGFLRINEEVLDRLPEIVNGVGSFVTVPMQGSGTFAVEAMLTTFVPASGKCLLLINGAYGHRAKKILEIAKRAVVVYETAEDTPPDVAEVEAILAGDGDITHVFAVHCETTSGILNPIAEIGRVVARQGRHLLIDSMSAFGALPLDVAETSCDAIAASSNKCIEGVPGLGFVLCREDALAKTQGNATTLVLDLYDQWRAFVQNGQYRFTPPIHVIVSFHQALKEFFEEGGQPGRGARYWANADVLIEGMRGLGFKTLLPGELQAPIIVTFHMPDESWFQFQTFYDRLKDLGYVIYPGKLTVAETFRIGCIGRLDQGHMRDALAVIAAVTADMRASALARAE